MFKILVVEDEEAILMGLQDNLELEGYNVAVARDGEEALQRAVEFQPDLVLLDLMLPKKNGFEVCRELRHTNPNAFVIMLTAKTDEASKVTGLEIGADDYVTKPFSILELLARIKASLRRRDDRKEGVSGVDNFIHGPLRVDFKRFEASVNGVSVLLNTREFQILRYLVSRRGEVVLREELLEEVWGYSPDAMPTTRTVDNHIVKLRQKLEQNPTDPQLIVSIRGAGYKLDV